MKDLTDNKKFWNTVKPIFSNKAKGSSHISLIENDKLLTAEEDVTETLNKHFVDSVKNLVEKDSSSAYITDKSVNACPVKNIIEKFCNHA